MGSASGCDNLCFSLLAGLVSSIAKLCLCVAEVLLGSMGCLQLLRLFGLVWPGFLSLATVVAQLVRYLSN